MVETVSVVMAMAEDGDKAMALEVVEAMDNKIRAADTTATRNRAARDSPGGLGATEDLTVAATSTGR